MSANREPDWRWWATWLTAVGGLFVAYGQYRKDVADIRAEAEAAFELRLAEVRTEVDALEAQLEECRNARPAESPGIDWDDYRYLLTEPAADDGTWTGWLERHVGDGWPSLAVLAALVLLGIAFDRPR